MLYNNFVKLHYIKNEKISIRPNWQDLMELINTDEAT
jgi:hypothetical protein